MVKIKPGFPLYFLFMLLLTSCGSKEESSLPSIDLTQTYEIKKLTLQDMARVKYIPLETNTA